MIKYECCRCWNNFELKELEYKEYEEVTHEGYYACPKCGGGNFEIHKEKEEGM